MKDRDERFWAALTTRIDAARRSDRSEEEQLADAERFLQATEDEPLRPELVQEVIDEVSGKREARQVATFPVGANLDRRWHMTRGAAAALVGSVLLLGGYAAMAWGLEKETNPDDRILDVEKATEIPWADALAMVSNPAQGAKRRTDALGIVFGATAAALESIRETSNDLSIGAEASEAMESLRAVALAESSAAPDQAPRSMSQIKLSMEVLRDEAASAERRLAALNLVTEQAELGVWAILKQDLDGDPPFLSNLDVWRLNIQVLLRD